MYTVPCQTQEAPPEVQAVTSGIGFCFPSHSCQVEGIRLEGGCRICTMLQLPWEGLKLWDLGHVSTGRSQMIHKSLYQEQLAHCEELHQLGVCQHTSNYRLLWFFGVPWECSLFSDPFHHQWLLNTCPEIFLLCIGACSKPFALACQVIKKTYRKYILETSKHVFLVYVW